MNHTVKKGESLWGIAKKYLGDGNRYREIQKANGLKTEMIKIGMVLKIPTATNYEEIGKAFEEAVQEVDSLQSVQKLYQMVGD